ncbi:MAG: ABC transporter substrate-binding protein [Myxococcales bacterium]|nr:ABC transporter substrate-binding protein [Myxococcales bacterium]
MALALALGTAACEGDSGVAGEAMLVRMLPITGPLGQQAARIEEGQNLALAEINAAGGVLGQTVAYRTLDTRADPDAAATQASMLADRGTEFLLGAVSSSVTDAVLSAIDGSDMLVVSSASGSSFLTGRHEGLFFRTSPTLANVVDVLTKAVVAEGHEHVGILESSNFYTASLSKGFQQRFEASTCGSRPCRTTVFAYDEGEDFTADYDFEAGVEALLKEEAEAILFSCYPRMALAFCRRPWRRATSEPRTSRRPWSMVTWRCSCPRR